MSASVQDLARHILQRRVAYDRALQGEMSALERRFGALMLKQAVRLAAEAEQRDSRSITGQRRRETAKHKAERAAQALFTRKHPEDD